MALDKLKDWVMQQNSNAKRGLSKLDELLAITWCDSENENNNCLNIETYISVCGIIILLYSYNSINVQIITTYEKHLDKPILSEL